MVQVNNYICHDTDCSALTVTPGIPSVWAYFE